jgi:transposase
MDNVAVVALDIHKKFAKAVKMDKDGKVLEEAILKHPGRNDYDAFLGNLDKETDVVMEATFNWPWIADLIESMGLTPHLAHPPRARELAKGMAKTDRRDAIFLGDLFLAGKLFPRSYLAPVEVRRMRDIFRIRLLFVRMRTMIKNNIHGQMFRAGAVFDEETSDLFSKKGRAILKDLALPEHERHELDRKLDFLDDLSLHIENVEEELKTILEKDERAKFLMSIPGVGEIIAYTILAEVGTIDRFINSRALAAYAGVLPLAKKSADKDYGSMTCRMSNRFLRWAAIEAVTGAVRSSPRMRAKYLKVRKKNEKAGKARVAIAREVMELAWLVLKKKVYYTETPPPRPGSIRKEARIER